MKGLAYVFGEYGGVNAISLLDVIRVLELCPKLLLQAVQLIVGEVWFLVNFYIVAIMLVCTGLAIRLLVDMKG